MFKGDFKLNEKYYAMSKLDGRFTVINNFRNKYDLVITNIYFQDGKFNEKDYIFELENSIIIRFTRNTCEIEAEVELDDFQEMYDYLKYYLTNCNYQVGDVVYYNRQKGKVVNVLEDGYIEVASMELNNLPNAPTKKITGWCLRFT